MKYQPLPELSAADFEVLKQDIAAQWRDGAGGI